jgi:hypothetical protein
MYNVVLTVRDGQVSGLLFVGAGVVVGVFVAVVVADLVGHLQGNASVM